MEERPRRELTSAARAEPNGVDVGHATHEPVLLKKVVPYHSESRRHRATYHDRSDCPYGRKISSASLVAGTGELPYCFKCQELNEVIDLRQ